MRIRLEASDRLPFWIIGDPAHNERTEGSEALGESLQISRNQQTITGAEWEAKTFYDRGNQSVTVEATARREFADEWERHQFLETLAPTDLDEELHRWEGVVWLRFPKADGTFNESLMPDAILSLSGKQLDGAVGVRLTYRIQAPGFDIASAQAGVEKVFLVADGTPSDTCQMLLFLTTSGGDFDTAGTVFSGVAPASLTVGATISLTMGDNFGVVTARTFEVVAPAGAASGGRIAIETPVVDNLDVIATALSGITGINVNTGVMSGRNFVYLGWSAAPISDPTEVIISISFSTGYECGSTAADFNVATIPDTWLVDDNGVHLIADRITS